MTLPCVCPPVCMFSHVYFPPCVCSSMCISFRVYGPSCVFPSVCMFIHVYVSPGIGIFLYTSPCVNCIPFVFMSPPRVCPLHGYTLCMHISSVYMFYPCVFPLRVMLLPCVCFFVSCSFMFKLPTCICPSVCSSLRVHVSSVCMTTLHVNIPFVCLSLREYVPLYDCC